MASAASELQADAPMSVNRSLKGAFFLTAGCFGVWGLAYGLLDVLNKHVQETLHVGKADSSWLQVSYFGAYLSMSIPAGVLLERRGYKVGMITGLLVTAVGAASFVPSAAVASFPCFVISMFVMATGLCFLETTADTYMSVLGPSDRAPQRLNFAQSINALGVIVGPLIGGCLFFNPAVVKGFGGEQKVVGITYLLIAILVCAYAWVLGGARLPQIDESIDTDVREDTEYWPCLWSHKQLALGVITQACYVGAQVGIGAFFINLVTELWPGLSSQQGAFMLSLAMLGYLAGRFTSTVLLLRVSPEKLLIAYGLVDMALCVFVACGIEKLSAIALVVVFFCMGGMFATIFTLGVRHLGGFKKRGASLMVMAIGGGAIFPYPMGKLAEVYGTPMAFLLPAASFSLVAYYGLWTARREKGTIRRL